MSRTKPAQDHRMQSKQTLGRVLRHSVFTSWQDSHYAGRKSYLQRLAKSQWLHRGHARQKTLLFWVWSCVSRRSNVSSSSESIELLPRITRMCGRRSWSQRVLLIDIITSLTVFAAVFHWTFLRLKSLRRLPTKNPLLNIDENFSLLCKSNLRKDVTLVRLNLMKSKVLLDPFKPHHSLLYQSQVDLGVIASYKTIPFHTFLQRSFQTLRSTLILIRIISQVLGARFTCLRSPSVGYHRVRKWQSGMFPKRIAQFRSTLRNGRVQWCEFRIIYSALILACVLDCVLQPELMARLLTLDWTYFERKESDQHLDGSMTIFLYAFSRSSFRLTTKIGRDGIKRSRREVDTRMEAGYGTEGISSRTVRWRSLTKTAVFLSKIYQKLHQDRTKTRVSRATSLTLMKCRTTFISHGRNLKTNRSRMLTRTLALCGTWRRTTCIYPKRRNENISWRSISGGVVTNTFFLTCSSYMVNYYIHHLLSREDAYILHPWRRCCASPLTNPFSHEDRSKAWKRISTGGEPCSRTHLLGDQYLGHYRYMTQQHIRMPAPALALLSSLGTDGEHGDLGKVGRHWTAKKTSDGPKQLDSSCLLNTLSVWEERRSILGSTETIKGSSKAGVTGGAGAHQSTQSSKESLVISTIPPHLTLSTQRTSKARTTQRMDHRGEFMEVLSSCYHPSLSPKNLDASSLIPSSCPQTQRITVQTNSYHNPANSLLATIPMQRQITNSNSTETHSTSYASINSPTTNNPKFRAVIPAAHSATPLPYKAGLIPIPSVLRPHCLARERLRLWFPSESRIASGPNGKTLAISEEDLERVLMVMNLSWAVGTRECYGAGLLVFHVFCDERKVPEDQRCPVDTRTILNFVSSCAGSYSGRTLTNYVYAIKAWHILHGQPWLVQQDELKAALEGASELTPATSKRTKREPFTVKLILIIRSHLNLTTPLDAAVYACLTSAFFALCRLGELTVKTIKTFDPKNNVKRSNVEFDVEDRQGFSATKIFLPRTKVSAVGEGVYWAQQESLADPKAALLNHFEVNNPRTEDHLFAWKHAKGSRPLTRSEFWKRVGGIVKRAGLGDLKGHGLRIGGTLEYLLRGVPFDVVKSIGRWSSEAFTGYLRKHALILAPYLQESPALEPFTRYTMPPAH